MLSKLLKHEYHNTYKETLFVNGGIIMVSILISALFMIGLQRIAAFLLISLIALYLMSGVVIIINIVKSFHTKMFTDEGYLTMTLPVSIDHLLLSKIIVNLTYIIFTAVIFITSLIITMNSILGTDVFNIFDGLLSVIRDNPLGTILYIINFAISFISFVLTLILTLALLNIGKIKKYKLLAGIGIYYGLNFAIQLFSTVFNLIPYVIDVSGGDVSIIDNSNNSSIANFILINVNTILVSVVSIVSFYFISRYLIKNKLELI